MGSQLLKRANASLKWIKHSRKFTTDKDWEARLDRVEVQLEMAEKLIAELRVTVDHTSQTIHDTAKHFKYAKIGMVGVTAFVAVKAWLFAAEISPIINNNKKNSRN